jgi:hypothetical protein
LLRDGARFAFRSGAIDSSIQSTEARDRPIHQITNVAFAADVGADKNSLRSVPLKLCSQVLSFFFPAAGHDNLCTFLRESDGGGPADAC